MRSLNLGKGTMFFGGAALLYVLVVIAKADEPNGIWRIIFLAALVSIAGFLHFRKSKTGFVAPTFFKFMHLFLAVLYFWGAAFGKWAKRGDPDEGALSAMGGTGFGLIAIVLGVMFLILAVMRIMGRSKVLPGMGVEQLTMILGIAAWMNVLAFIVGWLATFEAGVGWGVVVAYFPASLIPQLGALTLAATEPATTVAEIDPGKRRAFSLIALLGGLGVALFPFLAYITDGTISLSALEGKTGDGLSGPRLGYILLIFGVYLAGAALMRMRPKGLAEPGPNALHGHGLFVVGLVAFLIPLATLISIVRLDIDVNAGIGLWLGLVAGVVLMAIALVENRIRGAVGV